MLYHRARRADGLHHPRDLLLVSGVYYPVTRAAGLAAGVLVHLARDLRAGRAALARLIRQVSRTTLWADIWPLLICAVVSIPVGLFIFNRAERYAKRTGKLKRNG